MTPVELTEYPSIADIARKCLEETDPLAAVDRVIKIGQISQRDVFTLNIELARAFRGKRDPMTSASFLAGARRLLQPGQNDLAAVLIKELLTLGDKQTASEVAIEIGLRQALPSSLEELEILAVTEGHQQAKRQLTAIRDHGHALLIEHLEKNVEAIAKAAGRQLVLIEVGSTREQVPTQGSTEKIASFCQKKGFASSPSIWTPITRRLRKNSFSKWRPQTSRPSLREARPISSSTQTRSTFCSSMPMTSTTAVTARCGKADTSNFSGSASTMRHAIGCISNVLKPL
jgi:hypothetical protein